MHISKKKTIYFLGISIIVFLCLKLDSIQYITGFGQIYREIPILLLVVLAIYYALKCKSISIITFYLIVYYVFLLAVTILKGGAIHTVLIQVCPSVCMVLLCELNMKKKPIDFLQVIGIFLSLMVILDFVSIVLYPDGLYRTDLYTENWFLGYKTQRINIAVPAVAALATTSLYKKNVVSSYTWFILLISLITAILSQATGGVIALTLFCVFFILVYGIKRNERFQNRILQVLNAKFILVVIIAINILISIIQNIALFEPIIVGIFGKSMTLTGRTYIWTRCMEIIRENPIFGMGYVDSVEFVHLTGIAGGTQPHNMILAFLVYSGVIGLILYAIPLYKSIAKINTINYRLSSFFEISIIVNLVIGITSMNNYTAFNFASIVILWHVNKINQKEPRS